ncbi:hypothetical protein DRN34_04695 [Thermococci archaeon]|nr:MAG: hypothetical protein DRN34_04695 [Thermococci archaeon]
MTIVLKPMDGANWFVTSDDDNLCNAIEKARKRTKGMLDGTWVTDDGDMPFIIDSKDRFHG